MFDGDRIVACSLLVKDGIFFSGIVGAAMKNKVSYNMRLRLEKETGDPLNSSCECPAGKGPHGTCKHIAAMLLMLEQFSVNGKVGVAKTCTESLQTFNKPKAAYNGSPVKAESLPGKRKMDDVLADPRPAKFRNWAGYNDHVRNTIINYTARTSQDVAFRYLIPKANIQEAAKDHDYLPLPFTQYWVDTAVQVTKEKAASIEHDTRLQASSDKWFEERSWRLTASRFGEICKLTARRNMNKLCSSLYGQTFLATPAILHGKNYESKAIKAFETRFHCRVKKCGLFVSVDSPHLGASPDGLVGEDAIVEVKCPYAGRNLKITPGSDFKFLEMSNGQVGLKTTSNYYFQVQGQLYITGRQMCYFIVYTLKDLFVQKIMVDREYCKYSLIPKLDLFYIRHYRPYISLKI